MSKGKKYSISIEQIDSHWRAQIVRQVTSRDVRVSKEKTDFASEAEATAWANAELLEFANTLNKSNARHGKQRKELEEIKRQRSSRRAIKTQRIKDEKAQLSSHSEVPVEDEAGTNESEKD